MVLLVLPLLSQPCHAAESEQSATVMDEVIVSASRVEEKKREVTANVTVISRQELAKSPSTSVGELLTEKGLGHIQKYPGALTSIGLRGFRTDTHGNDLQGHVLILLDGRRAGSGNAHKLLTKNVERIEIIRGPGAVQYGSAGMGGIINIISRKGQDNSLFVETGAGSYNRKDAAVGGTAKTAALDFSGAVSYQKIDDYKTGSGDTFTNTGIDKEIGLSFNAGYSFGSNHRIGLIFNSDKVREAGYAGYFFMADEDDYSNKSNYSADLQYTGKSASEKTQWMARFFLGEDENEWVDPVASNPDFWDDGIPSTNHTDQLGAQLQGSMELGFINLTTGFDWVDYQVENSWSPQKSTYSNPAVFLLGKTRFLDNSVIATFGLRYDWFKVEVEEPVGRQESKDNITPQIGLAYNPTDNLKLRLQYAEGFMMPSADQLAIDTISWGTRRVGNPNLRPEGSQTYEAGFDYFKGSFTSSISYFHTDFSDKIVTYYLANGNQSWRNQGDATLDGFELELGYDLGVLLGTDWEIRPYLGATILTNFKDEETGDDLLYISDTSLSAGISIDNFQGFTSQLNVAHYSSQNVEDWVSGIYPAPIIEIDQITTVYLTLSYKFYQSEQYGAFTVSGNINNLFDEEYEFVQGYPMPGRSLFVKLRWDF